MYLRTWLHPSVDRASRYQLSRFLASLVFEIPVDREHWIEQCDLTIASFDLRGEGDRLIIAPKRHHLFAHRKPVERRPVQRNKRLQLVERVFFFEDMRKATQRIGRREDTGTTT